MTDFTPTPWKVEENCLGVYPISAKQGPLVVQPAKAFGEGDAAFIVKAVNDYQAMQAILVDVWFYFSDSDDPKFKQMADAARALIPDLVGGAHD